MAKHIICQKCVFVKNADKNEFLQQKHAQNLNGMLQLIWVVTWKILLAFMCIYFGCFEMSYMLMKTKWLVGCKKVCPILIFPHTHEMIINLFMYLSRQNEEPPNVNMKKLCRYQNKIYPCLQKRNKSCVMRIINSPLLNR